MFTNNEVAFLKKELNAFAKRCQARIDEPDLSDVARENIENRLICAVTVVNKLEHTQPDAEPINKETRVLIVDDVESMRKVHRHYLMTAGFKSVDLAEDGHRALKMLRSAQTSNRPYNLIISDWEMPKMTGLELLKEVRMDKELWRVPFYLITSLSEKKYIVQSINMGSTGYIIKPVNQKIISNKFVQYLNT